MPTGSTVSRRVQVVAHRGASALAPENTLVAFRRALEMDVDGLELDLQPTRDGQLVVLHDERLERTTNGRGYVFEYTLAELRALDAGSWFHGAHSSGARYDGQRIPTLDEVIDLVRDGRQQLYIEIKKSERTPERLEENVVEVIHRHGFENRVVLISFDPNSLRRVRQLAPAVATAILFKDLPADPIFLARTIGATGIAPRLDRVTREFVEAAHRAGMQMVVWTVDSPEDMQKLIDFGVNGIVTNVPDQLLNLLANAEV